MFLNDEIGPLCCDSDGLDVTIPRPGAPTPMNVTLDAVNIHDVYDSCALLMAQLPGTPCSGQGFESGCSGCEHPDGTQWFGAVSGTIRDSTFCNINPGGTAAQGIFMQPANGGRFEDITITGNTLCATANNTLSISGPGVSDVTGTTTITGNSLPAGNIRLYGDTSPTDRPIAAPATIIVSANTAASFETTNGNGCTLILGDGSTYTPIYSGNRFGNGQCEG